MRFRVADYFAGLGGVTLGAHRSGAVVVRAINHWDEAVKAHADNHPEVPHSCEDLTRFDPSRLEDFDCLAAGPACQGHSVAGGSTHRKRRKVKRTGPELAAHWDASRATAWSVIDCLEVRRPPAAMIENVPRFLKWALLPSWLTALAALGYRYRVNVCDTSLWGLPQERDRVVITALYGREAPAVEPPRSVTLATARDVIDFDDGEWTLVRKKVEATRSRVANGRRQFGRRFVMPYNGSGSGLTGRSLDRPIGTITAADRWGVVDGERMRMLTARESLVFQGFPPGYKVPARRDVWTELTGNAMPPVLAAAGVRALREAA